MFTILMELTIGRDRLVLKNLKSGRAIESVAKEPFSSEEMLVARPGVFNSLAHTMAVELKRDMRFWQIPKVKVKTTGAALSETETIVVKQKLMDQGYTHVSFSDDSVDSVDSAAK